jgi:hypothetical protein
MQMPGPLTKLNSLAKLALVAAKARCSLPGSALSRDGSQGKTHGCLSGRAVLWPLVGAQ